MNPLQVLNQKLRAREKQLRARRKRKAAAVIVSLFLTVLYATLCVQRQIKPVATFVEVDEPDALPAGQAQTVESAPSPQPVQTARIILNADSFENGYQLLSYAQQNAAPSQRDKSAQFRQVSLPIGVMHPKQEAKAHAWAATLADRKGIARRYLEGKCPNILKLEGMQSTAEAKRVDGRFMLAKSPDAVVAVVRSEIRNSTVATYMCPDVVAGK